MKASRRIPTRQLASPWPFLYGVVEGRGIVKNLPPAVNQPKPRKLARPGKAPKRAQEKRK